MQALANAAAFLRLAALAAVLAIVGLLGVRPSIDGQSGARAMGPLPACRYDDILTSPRGYGSWSETLVDTILRVPKTYVPPDLVSVSTAGIAGSGKVRAVVIDDLREMAEAATLAGNPIGVRSAYRSYATQQTVFRQYVARDGYNVALTYSARPGHSEHQLGLGIDFRSDPPVATLSQSWGATPAGAWMRRNAWKYGFLMSYPKGKMSVTCYSYEPWHFRYVGKALAAKIHASGLTPRQYLWANFTTTVVPKVTPKPTARATPVAVTTPRASPTIEPSPTVQATASPTVAPATLAPPSPPPTLPPSAAPTPAPPTPSPTDSPAAPAALDPAAVASVALGGAALALGTIVLGGVFLLRRRGRSGLGL